MLTLPMFFLVLAVCVAVGGVGLAAMGVLVACGARHDIRLTTRPSAVGSRPIDGP